ncbi:hypothetical protein D910_12162 [Dendroctonus ponderosae]|uniref:Transposase Tc1-like domain-containing protein n=1 Tax=Dendroctonus ponderosae TaxID=77166 RepID=U4ULF2_DENPD|nr:hypothetical protein D910_12162 [Dendroctonus ponderosae]
MLVFRSAENIAVVCDSAAEEPSTSTRRRAQQVNISRTSLMRILNKDLNSHAHKVQLPQELKPADHFQRRQYAVWLIEQTEVNGDFTKKIIFSDHAHFWLSGFVSKQNCRIWANENLRVIGKSRCIHKE